MQKIKNCIIINIEFENNEFVDDQFDKMLELFCFSIRRIYTDISIYGYYFKKQNIPVNIIKLLNHYKIHLIHDPVFDSNLPHYYFLRNFVQQYAINSNLLENYDNIIYLDIDTILLQSFPNNLFDQNQIVCEQVPLNIYNKYESNHFTNIENKEPILFYNWFQIINKYNYWIYNFEIDKYDKNSEYQLTQSILKSKIKKIDNTQPYYPKKELNESSYVFHYDTFNEAGGLIFLKKNYNDKYKKLLLFIEYKLKIKISTNTKFWFNTFNN